MIAGGVTSWPNRYNAMADALRELTGAEVYVAKLTPLDWLLGSIRGFGQLVFDIATTVDRALLESDSKKAILVGHSAGGVACRVYLGGDPPYGGRRYSGHRRVSHLITLGSPHNISARSAERNANRKSLAPIQRVNDLFPGALHEPAGLNYLSVAGSAADGASSARTRKRYERFVDDGRAAGDGAVPVEAALLPGAGSVVLDGVYHGPPLGRWYGSDLATVERWWPQELRVGSSLVQERRA